MRIKKHKGKYFGYFDYEEDAKQYLKDLVKSYENMDKRERPSIRKIVRDEKKRGIHIPRNTLSRYFHEQGVELSHNREREKIKVSKLFTLYPDTSKEIERYPNQSYIVDLALRITLGLPTKDIVIYFDQDVRVILTKNYKGKVKAIVTGNINDRDRNLIRSMAKLGQEQDMDAIASECERLGYKYFGNEQT